MGSIPTKIEGERVQPDASPDCPARRQADGDSLDDARRGGPRARHAQHVHGLPAQPGPPVPEHGERRFPRVRPQEQSAALCLRSQSAQRLRRHGLPELVVLAVQPGPRPGRPRLPGAGPEPARRHQRAAVHDSADGARRGQQPLRRAREERQHRGDGHVLPAGLQPDQLAEGPRGVQHRRRAGQGPRRIRPQCRRSAAADGSPAGGRRRAVRHRRVRRLGHAHPDRRRHERPDAGLRPGASRP